MFHNHPLDGDAIINLLYIYIMLGLNCDSIINYIYIMLGDDAFVNSLHKIVIKLITRNDIT